MIKFVESFKESLKKYKPQLSPFLQKIPEISPTFCVYPWMELILGPTSDIKLCCSAETAVEDENKSTYVLGQSSLENYWNSHGLRKVRRKMLHGEKVKACRWCYYDESIGKCSQRQGDNKIWLESKYGKEILERVEKSRVNGYRVKEQPLYLDIRPSNLCNLKCRMCVPEVSSKIEQEQREMLKSNLDTNFINTNYLKIDKKILNWRKNEEIWRTIYKWAPGLKKLYFTGGEPTLIKEIWEFIDYLKEKDYSKNIDLIFNTNCTQNPDKLIETFEAFSSVEIRLSVDGYKEVNEYIRHPSKWEEIESNIVKMLKNKRGNAHFHFSPVFQVYNILDIPRLLKWIDKLQIYCGQTKILYSITRSIMLINPNFLNVAILPKNVKRKALLKLEKYQEEDPFTYKESNYHLLECLNSVKNVLKSKEKVGIEKDLRNFYKYTRLLDQHRGNSFEKTFPELNTLLNEDGRWKF